MSMRILALSNFIAFNNIKLLKFQAFKVFNRELGECKLRHTTLFRNLANSKLSGISIWISDQ